MKLLHYLVLIFLITNAPLGAQKPTRVIQQSITVITDDEITALTKKIDEEKNPEQKKMLEQQRDVLKQRADDLREGTTDKLQLIRKTAKDARAARGKHPHKIKKDKN